MRRCRKHLADCSSTVGVCASCLRDRLTGIMAAQPQYHVLQARLFGAQNRDDCRRSDSDHEPSLDSRRGKSGNPDAWKMPGNHERRLWDTAQIGFNGPIDVESARRKKSNGVKVFTLFLGLFRSKQGKTGLHFGANTDYRIPGPTAHFDSLDPRVSSGSSFQKDAGTLHLEKSVVGDERRASRGMSPEMFSNMEENDECRGGSSSECSQGWRQTPRRTPTSVRCSAPNGNMSGLKF